MKFYCFFFSLVIIIGVLSSAKALGHFNLFFLLFLQKKARTTKAQNFPSFHPFASSHPSLLVCCAYSNGDGWRIRFYNFLRFSQPIMADEIEGLLLTGGCLEGTVFILLWIFISSLRNAVFWFIHNSNDKFFAIVFKLYFTTSILTSCETRGKKFWTTYKNWVWITGIRFTLLKF